MFGFWFWSSELTEENVVSHGKVLSRGDRRRNERLARLRLIVRRDFAVVAVDLASAKQAVVVTDHDSMVLGRRMFAGDAWVIDDILDWAEPIAATPVTRVLCWAASRLDIAGSRCWTVPAPADWSWWA
jgi:hypothetical protein